MDGRRNYGSRKRKWDGGLLPRPGHASDRITPAPTLDAEGRELGVDIQVGGAGSHGIEGEKAERQSVRGRERAETVPSRSNNWGNDEMGVAT